VRWLYEIGCKSVNGRAVFAIEGPDFKSAGDRPYRNQHGVRGCNAGRAVVDVERAAGSGVEIHRRRPVNVIQRLGRDGRKTRMLRIMPIP